MRHAVAAIMLATATLATATLAAADAPAGRVVPDLIGMTPAQATAASRKAGFPPPSIAKVSDVGGNVDDLEPCWNGSRVGVVCAQTPAAGERADPAHPHDLFLGVEATEAVLVMPDLDGLTLEQAIAALKKAGFRSRPDSNFADRCKHGLVCGQRWPAGMKVRTASHQLLDLGR